MSTNEIDDNEDAQLPDAVIRNAERVQVQKEEAAGPSLLDQLASHIKQDQYIPWEKVQLPSKGVYYDGKIPDGFIRIKPMGVDVDKMLANQRLIQSGDILNNILRACTELDRKSVV